MADLTPVAGLDPVVQLETTTPALAGPGGPMNAQAQALLNRTAFLVNQINTLIAELSGATGAQSVGYGLSTVAEALDDLFANPGGGIPDDNSVSTPKLQNGAVTFAKLQDIASGRLIGRSTAGSGDPEEISLGASLMVSSGVLLSSLVINIRDYASLVVAGDWTPAFNAALAAAATSGTRIIYFPYIVSDNSGNYSFKTKPNTIGIGITLMGENPRQFLVRDYAPTGAAGSVESTFILFDGSANPADTNQNKGGGIVNLGLGAGAGTAGGVALHIRANNTFRGGYMRFSNVVISVPNGSTGTWAFGLLIKGQDANTAGSQGVRDITFEGLYIFRCTGDAGQITNGVHIFIHGLNVNDGGAGNPSPAFRVNGLGTALTNSISVFITGADIYGTLAFDQCSVVVVTGYVNTLATTLSATKCKVVGIVDVNNAVAGTTVL